MSLNTADHSNTIVTWMRRHQLVAFVILAYALSWWAWVWFQLDPVSADAPILPLGPLLAALIVLVVTGGWPAVSGFLAKIIRWRVNWFWYAVALLLPVVLTFVALGINMLLGAQRIPVLDGSDAGSLLFRFIFIFLLIGLGEEPAWRGFALPMLLERHPAIKAALILGAIHAIWHLPLVGVEYDGSNIVPWAITVFCFSLVTCWLYLNTGGSVLMPMLMHTSNNTVAIVWRMFEAGDQVRLWWIWCLLWVAATSIIVMSAGADLRKGPEIASR